MHFIQCVPCRGAQIGGFFLCLILPLCSTLMLLLKKTLFTLSGLLNSSLPVISGLWKATCINLQLCGLLAQTVGD